jgi:DNA-binding HxlR family transcriptional regulator
MLTRRREFGAAVDEPPRSDRSGGESTDRLHRRRERGSGGARPGGRHDAADVLRREEVLPVAATTKVMGDTWTPLIVRELLYGTAHFNQLTRNVPGISRTLLASRLRSLERAGLLTCERECGRTMTSYCVTPAGRDLGPVIEAMNAWGTRWAAPGPAPEEVGPLIMICMLTSRMRPGGTRPTVGQVSGPASPWPWSARFRRRVHVSQMTVLAKWTRAR